MMEGGLKLSRKKTGIVDNTLFEYARYDLSWNESAGTDKPDQILRWEKRRI